MRMLTRFKLVNLKITKQNILNLIFTVWKKNLQQIVPFVYK